MQNAFRQRLGLWLERSCLIVLLAILGLRSLISETYDSAGVATVSALEGIEDVSPVTTVLLDGAILLTVIGWIVSAILRGNIGYRRTGLEWGGLIIAVAGAVSCLYAGNKRLAVNGTVDWLCCLLMGLMLVQLLRGGWRIRLTLAVMLASAGAQVVECFHQIYFVYPETEARHEAEREDFWARQGLPPDAEEARLFEARLNAREASGYLSHPNIAGAHLITCGLATLAVGFSACRRPSRLTSWTASIPCVLIAATMLLAAFFTGSLGAMVAGAVGIILLLIRLKFKAVFDHHPQGLFWGGWALVLGTGAAVVGYGLVAGGLPGRTLDFRWKYWSASARMFVDRPVVGVGAENFGRHYLKYKTIDSPEEIKNPHNFLVSAATSWGAGGAIGVVTLMFGGSLFSVRRRTRSDQVADDEPPAGLRRWLAAAALLAVLIFGPRVFLLGSDDPNYRYFATALPALAWITTFIVVAATPFPASPTLAVGLGCALIAFLLQDTINFAVFVPGTLTTALGLVAVMQASRRRADEDKAHHRWKHPSRWLAAAVGVALIFALVGVVPVTASYNLLREARRGGVTTHAVSAYERAAWWDPLDSRPLFEGGRLAYFMVAEMGGDEATLRRAADLIDAAIARDPVHLPLHRLRARIHLLAAERQSAASEWSAAVQAARVAIQLYPTDPDGHVLLAQCLASQGRALRDEAPLKEAIEHYRRALAIDDARPTEETIRRLRPAKRQALQEAASELESVLADIARKNADWNR